MSQVIIDVPHKIITEHEAMLTKLEAFWPVLVAARAKTTDKGEAEMGGIVLLGVSIAIAFLSSIRDHQTEAFKIINPNLN